MKKAYFLFAFIWCLLVLAACGKTDEEPHYYEIRVESGQLEELESEQFLLGQQYYQGEPMSIIAEASGAEGTGSAIDVYIRPIGGEMQLLMGGVPRAYRTKGWYLDEKGRCFIVRAEGITRLDADGKLLYQSSPTEGLITDICCLEGGRIILLTNKSGFWQFWELDPDTGEIARIDEVSKLDGLAYIGAWENNLMILDKDGFWQVDLERGTKELVLPFAGTLYSVDNRNGETPADFWVDGSEAGILWDSGRVERLERTDITGEKEIITVRGQFGLLTTLKQQLNLFNQSSDSYFVVVQEPGEGVGVSDFHTETNLKLASGQGADIIFSNAVNLDVSGLIEKGVFLDLAPLMEASGIREEDYFPAAFASWREDGKIYGIVTNISIFSHTLDKEVLNGREELTIETLVDSMLEFEGDRVFYSSWDGAEILNGFLEGSGNLCGMVDWEEGTCDFSGELFSRMLSAAKRYADDGHQYPAIMGTRRCANLYNFDTTEVLERKNQVDMGVFFDDGHHVVVSGLSVTMGINAASEHVEGAWELLAFLLGEEAQMMVDYYKDAFFPVNRNAFDRLAQEEAEYGVTIESEWNGKVYIDFVPGRYGQVVTEDMVEEMRQMLAEAETRPYKIKPLLSIIREETAYYFNDAKDMDEVIGLVQNRVQLYLDEHKTSG